MTDLQRAERVLSALGRPAGHAAGLYRKRIKELAALWDVKANAIEPGARTVWLKIHTEILGENKGADEVTDEADATPTE